MLRLLALCFVLVFAAAAARAGETRCWFENGAVVVPAAFGDMAGDFILDLSAPKSQLHATRAQTDGIEAATVRRDLRLAGARIAAVEMDVVDLDARTWSFPTSIVGVLGADVLRGRTVEIAFAPCRVRIGAGAFTTGATATRLKVRFVGGVPAVAARISDGVEVRGGLFRIDTSAAATTVTGARLSRSPAPGHTPPVRLRAVAVADELFERVPAAVSNGAPAESGGSIGTAVWSRFAMRMDMRRGWLELDHPPLHEDAGSPRPGRVKRARGKSARRDG